MTPVELMRITESQLRGKGAALREAAEELLRMAERHEEGAEHLRKKAWPVPGSFLRDRRDGRTCVAILDQDHLVVDYFQNDGRKEVESWLDFDLVQHGDKSGDPFMAGGPGSK